MSSFFNYHIKGRIKMALERAQLNRSISLPVLVFTMAKVGSSSVYNSLKHTTKLPAFHIHSLDEQEMYMANQRCFDAGLYPDSRSPIGFINNDIINKKRPYKVISLFRNPMERNLSAFFDAFRLMVGVEAQDYQGEIDDLIVTFHEKINHSYPSDWFSEYFNPALDIDVYEHDFDKQLGYGFIEKGSCSVLLMNSAVSDDKKEKIIAEFLQEPAFKLTNANIRSSSKAADLYHDFKSHINFNKDYLDALIGSRYFKHFFKEEDGLKTLETWAKA